MDPKTSKCLSLRRLHGVVPGETWGGMQKVEQLLWETMGCNDRVEKYADPGDGGETENEEDFMGKYEADENAEVAVETVPDAAAGATDSPTCRVPYLPTDDSTAKWRTRDFKLLQKPCSTTLPFSSIHHSHHGTETPTRDRSLVVDLRRAMRTGCRTLEVVLISETDVFTKRAAVDHSSQWESLSDSLPRKTKTLTRAEAAAPRTKTWSVPLEADTGLVDVLCLDAAGKRIYSACEVHYTPVALAGAERTARAATYAKHAAARAKYGVDHVLVLGLDNTARRDLKTFMPQTYAFLKDTLGARPPVSGAPDGAAAADNDDSDVDFMLGLSDQGSTAYEMRKFNTVGTGTTTHLTGMFVGEDQESPSLKGDWTARPRTITNWPWVWGQFANDAGFVTSLTDSSRQCTAWECDKLVSFPTQRTWLGLEGPVLPSGLDHLGDGTFHTSSTLFKSEPGQDARQCAGTATELVRHYHFFDDLLEAYGDTAGTTGSTTSDAGGGKSSTHGGVGVFAVMHNDVNHISRNGWSLQHSDAGIVAWLRKLHHRGVLQRTAVFLYSDHGPRIGSARSGYVGKMAERMPFLWAVLPNTFLRALPDASLALWHNQQRLSTAFDFHATLKHLLALLTDSNANGRGGAAAAKDVPYATNFKKGKSLFNALSPARMCNEAHIDPIYCLCASLSKIDPTDSKAAAVSRAAIAYITRITDIAAVAAAGCKRQTLQEVIMAYSSSVGGTLATVNGLAPNAQGVWVPTHGKAAFDVAATAQVTVQMRTSPGNHVYEVEAKFNAGADPDIVRVSRLSPYADDVASCKKYPPVHTEGDLVIRSEQYCTCRDS